MANSIKYLNYTVVRDGETINSGTVPAVIAFTGSIKDYDLGGIWLSRSAPKTEINIGDESKTVIVHSDRNKTEWLSYLEKLNSGEIIDRP
jgi:hypothetical protein